MLPSSGWQFFFARFSMAVVIIACRLAMEAVSSTAEGFGASASRISGG
jgi:hypothetical protein